MIDFIPTTTENTTTIPATTTAITTNTSNEITTTTTVSTITTTNTILEEPVNSTNEVPPIPIQPTTDTADPQSMIYNTINENS